MSTAYKYDIFLCYAENDEDSAQALAEELSRLGFCISKGLRGKHQLSKQLIAAMEDSAVGVLLFSSNDKASGLDENLKLAIHQRTESTNGIFRLVPVLLSKTVPTERMIQDIADVSQNRIGAFVCFNHGAADRIAIDQLVMRIRGVGTEVEIWSDSYFRDRVRQRAKNFLNVNWSELVSGLTDANYHFVPSQGPIAQEEDLQSDLIDAQVSTGLSEGDASFKKIGDQYSAASDIDERLKSLREAAITLLREVESLTDRSTKPTADLGFNDEVQRYEMELIRTALHRTRNNQRLAARLLGVTITTLQCKIKRFSIFRLDDERNSNVGDLGWLRRFH